MSLSQLSRGIITTFMVITLAVLGFVSPSYAAPASTGSAGENMINIVQTGDGNSITIVTPPSPTTAFPSESVNDVLGWVSDGVIETAKVMVGGAIVCYTVDGLATTIFPPAGALLPFCPMIGGAAGGQLLTKVVM